MNATAAEQIAAALPDASTYTNHSGLLCGAAHNGSRKVTFRDEGNGTVQIVLAIDYGKDGSSWCGSKSYRTAAGALRYARGFLTSGLV